MLKLQVIGNLGKDATYTKIGDRYAINFSVAEVKKYKDKQGNTQEQLQWVDCSYWLPQPTISQYLTKGTRVFAEGRPEVKAYMKGETPIPTLHLRVSFLDFHNSNTKNKDTNTTETDNDDQLPF